MRLTPKQEAIRKFIDAEQHAGRACPTHREIAKHFEFSGPNAAAKHLKALIKKGGYYDFTPDVEQTSISGA